MAEYIESLELQNRLTAVGYAWVADRDQGGSVSAPEIAENITPAIAWAGNTVDGYLANQITPAIARGASNAWLKNRCTDIAAYYACTQGGRSCPESVKEFYDIAIKQLEAIQEGSLIPGFPYPAPQNARWTNRTPKIANWGSTRWGTR